MPKSVTAGLQGSYTFSSFKQTAQLCSQAAAFPPAMDKRSGSAFCASSLAFGIITTFYFSHSDRCIVILICISLMASNTDHMLSYASLPCVYPLPGNACSHLLPIFQLDFFLPTEF